MSGTISTNTTWTLANSPYVMIGDVSVSAGVTLTIEAGVTVQGDSPGRTLNVNGSLSAVGTSSQHITFTSTANSAPGQWYQLNIASGSGTSTLDYVDAKFGGGTDTVATRGMVAINGGTITVDHSTFSQSAISGLSINGANGGATVTIGHSKFDTNGFVGGNLQGSGLYIVDDAAVVEDSAFWSNAKYGIENDISGFYGGSPAQISGSSIWNNKNYGVYLFQSSSGVAGLAADGNVSGKPGNAIYDNGTFGFTQAETWNQLAAVWQSGSVDWSRTYWGPVTFIPCTFGSQRGQVSFAVLPENPDAVIPVPRGPVSHTRDGNFSNWCGNDDIATNAPAYDLPNLYFNAPPPLFGGLLPEATRGCTDCQREALEYALAHDGEKGNAMAYTDQPVSTATGSLTEIAIDLTLPGPGIPFAWTRSYNSQDTSSGALGQGWADPFEATLTVINQTTGELLYHAGTGQQTHFTQVTGGSTGAAKYAGKGFDGIVQRLADNSYQITTRDQRIFSFDSTGKLTQIKPRFLPATSFAYTSGKLSSITDSAGRTITITYTISDPSLIEKVTLPDGRYVQYGYTNGRLTSVRDPRAKTWTLAYDTNGRLQSIQDPAGHLVLQGVTYYADGRVHTEQNGTSDTTTYDYTSSGGYDSTTVTVPGRGGWVYKHLNNMLVSVTDPLGHTTAYTYDAMGRRATVTDGNGKTTRYEYDAQGNVLKEVAPPPLGYTIVRTFNATNDLLTEKDRRDNTTMYAYASSNDPAGDYQVGQLKTITDREGGVTTLRYWTSSSSPTPPTTTIGLVKNRTNQRSKTTGYEYDTSGDLAKITSPLGLKTTMTYDASGRLMSRRDARGNVPVPPAGYLTQWTYDDADHVSTLTDPRGNVTSFDYTDNELPWKVTRLENDGTPRVTTLEYDNANHLWKTTTPSNGIETRLYWPDEQLKSVQSPEVRLTSFNYDNAGQLTSVVEPLGNAPPPGKTAADFTWTFGYDNAGNRTSEAHPDGGTRTIAYDEINRAKQWTDALGHSTTVVYDGNNNITTESDAFVPPRSRTLVYDKLDRLKTVTDERGKTTGYDYYATGELQKVTTPLGFKTTYTIDDDGRTSAMVDPRGNAVGADPAQYTWSYQYDEASNRTRVTDPLTNYVQYAYDAANDLTQVTDQRGNQTAFSYDSMNRLWRVTPPAAGGSGTLYTEYGYDADGNLSSRAEPNGHLPTTWTYDHDGLVTQRKTIVGTWNLTYDKNGNLTKLETPAGSATPSDPNDSLINYGYDRMSRRNSIDYSDLATPDVSRPYDAAGRPQSMSDGFGTVTYTFDVDDRLTDTARTGPDAGLNGTLHYDYDEAGNIRGRTYPDTTSTTETFDDDGRLTSVVSGGQTTSFGYDEASNLTTLTLPSTNGYVETRTYDRAGRLTTVENKKNPTILSKFAWTLDPAGNPTKTQTTRGGSDTYDAYEYDARNRLIASCYGIAQTAADCTGAANKITYTYDKLSKRSQEVRTGNVGNTGTITYNYNLSTDQLANTSIPGGPTTSYGYDTNGNETSAGNRTFTYDLANRLTSTSAVAGSPLTIGKGTIGASTNKLAANFKSGNKVTLTTWGSFTKISAYLDGLGTGNGSQTVRAYIYADSNGNPGARKAQSAEVTIAKNTAANWFDFTISPAVTLPPGDYWLVLHSGNTQNIIRRYGDTQTGAERNNTDTYSDGASDPFGTATSGNWSWSTKATYTPLANATYTYDGDGHRISSFGTSDLRYIWDPLAASNIPERVLERTPTASLVRRYLNGPLGTYAFTNSSANFYYHHDPITNITDVTNASGAAQWKYEYEAYGAQRTATDVSGSAPTNLLRFNSQYLDPDTNLYHLRARQYDPTSGRFTALDPVDNAIAVPFSDPYVYVDARPSVFVDPLGLCGPSWSGGLDCLKDVANAALGVAETATNTAAEVAPYTNPLTAASAIAKRAKDTYDAYRQCRGSWRCALDVFNDNFNPMYHALVDADACVHSQTARQAGQNCAQAGIDIATAAAVTSALARCAGAPLRAPVSQSPHLDPRDFANKTPAEIDRQARAKGLIPRGPDPMNGHGAYIDPVTGAQRVLTHPHDPRGAHVHVNDPTGQRLDINGNPVRANAPGAHLPIT